MPGSCERDACGGARLRRDTVQSFTAHRPNRQQPTSIRQGISSTDKDVIRDVPKVRATGGSSSLLTSGGCGDRGEITRRPGARRRVSRWSIPARSGQRLGFGETATGSAGNVRRPRGGFGLCMSGQVLEQRDSLPRSGLAAVVERPLRVKEVLPPVRHQPVRMESMDPVAIRYRFQSGNKAGMSCFMRTSGVENA